MLRPVALSIVVVALIVGLADGAAGGRSTILKNPTVSTCPAAFTIEVLNTSNQKIGEYRTTEASLRRRFSEGPLYWWDCVYLHSDTGAEAFLVKYDIVPPGKPGYIPSGDCAGNRSPVPPFYHSRKRYLTVSGGPRVFGQRAAGGDQRILLLGLRRAEEDGVGEPCSTTQPAPKPKPPGSGQSKGTLRVSWKMPKRLVPGPNGFLKYPRNDQITPRSYKVDLVVETKGKRLCRRSDEITWSGKGLLGVARTRVGRCTFTARFRTEGSYRLRVTLDGEDGFTGGATVDVVVQDWLIFGLGDSNGSGEGAPDKASPPLPSRKSPVWQSLQCDRSGNSYQAKTALSIEEPDDQTSVTFVHLACSGASIEKGLLGPYEGINTGDGRGRSFPVLRAQVREMERLAGTREIDAVIISIGVNDLRFGKLVEHCILYPSCFDRGFPTLSSPNTLDEWMKRRLDLLPVLYGLLAAGLENLASPRRGSS